MSLTNFSMPSASIIIPTRNRSAELAEALASLRAQTCDDWEAVVVDDASTEDIAAVVSEPEDGRIRLARLPAGRKGASAARNLGRHQTSGEFVLFLDSDDQLAPDAIERRLSFLKARPNLDFAVWGCQQFREVPGDLPLLWNQLLKPGEGDLDRYLRRDIPWQSASPLWRRAFLERVGDWDEEALSGQDWEFPLRALLLGPCYEKVDEVDHHWRIASSTRPSIGRSAAVEKEYTRSWARTVARARDHFETKGRLTGPGGQTLRERFAVLFWEAALRLADRVSAREGRVVWREARRRGLIDARRFWQGWSLLALRRAAGMQRRLRHRLMLAWPRPYFFPQNPTFNKARVPGAPPPRVSVVMSVFNAEPYIDECIRSLTRQSYRDLEILICDDGSTDRTGEILQRHTDGDCRIHLVREGKIGLVNAITRLIATARGEFIARMDGDDVAHPERIEREVSWLDNHPETVLVGAQCQDIDPFGIELTYYDLPRTHEEIDEELLRGNGGAIRQPSCMFRRQAYDAVGGYRREFECSEDTDLFLRLAEVGRVENLPDVLLRYRIHPKSINHARRHVQLAVKSEIVNQARQRRGLPPVSEELNDWRPDPPARQFLRWGWHALKLGRKDAARGHSLSLLRLRPFSPDAWRLFFCAMRGY